MKKFFREYFHYTQTEKRGSFFLVSILLVLLSFYWYEYEVEPVRFYSEELNKDVERFFQSQKEEDAESESSEVQLQPFDPNELSLIEWVELGFSEKQAKSIINYKNKIGGFRRKEDLKKLYVMTDQMYSRLEPFVEVSIDHSVSIKRIEDESEKQYDIKTPPEERREVLELVLVELNAADTTQLKSLKGIGSYYSNRIVKYRNILGGFVSVQQLEEVYGLKPEVVSHNLGKIIVDTSLVKRINVNTASVNDLKAHPYINWNMANSIVQIRESHGNYEALREIKKSDLVNDELYRKIAPYLKIEEEN